MWSFCAYNFFRAITLDPGTCPKPTNDAELKSVRTLPYSCAPNADSPLYPLYSLQIIEQLTSEGRLNGQTFCITCMVCALARHHDMDLAEYCVFLGAQTPQIKTLSRM